MGSINFITAEYLLNQFINFNKKIINKFYYKKSDGENLEEKVLKIIGEDNDLSIREVVENLNKISKVFVSNSLPDANGDETNYNNIYIVKDKNAVDEKNAYFIYTLKKVDGVNKWVCISSPSYIFETDKIDFNTAFTRVNNKYTRKVSFANFLNSDLSDWEYSLGTFLSNQTTMQYKGSSYCYYDFLTNDFNKCCILYNKKIEIVHYFENINSSEIDSQATESTKSYNISSDLESLNELAQNIQNPNGGLVEDVSGN